MLTTHSRLIKKKENAANAMQIMWLSKYLSASHLLPADLHN